MKGEQFEVVNLDAGFGVQFSSHVVIHSLAKTENSVSRFPVTNKRIEKMRKKTTIKLERRKFCDNKQITMNFQQLFCILCR